MIRFKSNFKKTLLFAVVISSLFLMFSCKQIGNEDNKDVTKYKVNFKVRGGVGELTAALESGKPIADGDFVEEGERVIFTITRKPVRDWWTVKWEGAEDYTDNEASVIVFSNVNVVLTFSLPEDFVEVIPPESGIVGRDSTNVVGSLEPEKFKGVFLEGRTVKISPYLMCKYEVSYKLWKEVYDWSKKDGASYAYSIAKGTKGMNGEGDDMLPITTISWVEMIIWCNAYTHMINGSDNECVYRNKTDKSVLKKASSVGVHSDVYFDKTKKGYRLPTEAEWEYAARYQKDNSNGNAEEYGAGIWLTKLDSASGADNNSEDEYLRVAWLQKNTGMMPKPVNEIELPGERTRANALGIYNMSGNVLEFVFDLYSHPLTSGELINPHGPEDGDKIVEKGGGYVSPIVEYGSVGLRDPIGYKQPTMFSGFRLVRN